MRQALAFFALALVEINSLFAADTNPELTRFQGDWEVTELVEDGKTIPREAIREWLPSGGRLKISENAIVFTSPHDGKSHAKIFSIDATRYPKGIDVTSREKQVSQGIYRFDENRLLVCFGDPTIAVRPNEFSAGQGSKRMLMILQRAESKPKVEWPFQNTALPTPSPSGTAAKVLSDAQVKEMLVGTWQLNDGLGLMYATISPNGTFQTTRDVQQIRLFQTVFVRTPVSSGTWTVQNGQLTYHVTSSIYPERANRNVTLFVRSISAKDLIFVDALGRVGTGVKVQ